MKIEVNDKGKKSEMEIVFSEMDHYTVGNLLREELIKGSSVSFAAHKRTHPLEDKSTLFVRAKSGPEKAVKAAAKRILEDLADFKKSFSAAFK